MKDGASAFGRDRRVRRDHKAAGSRVWSRHKQLWVDSSDCAVRKGRVEIEKLLLAEVGADTNYRSDSGLTPLHFAAKEGRVKIANLLVTEFGAGVNVKDNDGWIPLHWAMSAGYVKIAKLLMTELGRMRTSKKNGWIPKHSAANKGHVEITSCW